MNGEPRAWRESKKKQEAPFYSQEEEVKGRGGSKQRALL